MAVCMIYPLAIFTWPRLAGYLCSSFPALLLVLYSVNAIIQNCVVACYFYRILETGVCEEASALLENEEWALFLSNKEFFLKLTQLQ